MTPSEFEQFVAEVWSAQGWQTQVTTPQGDRGIDIVATRETPVPEKHLIQVKRYASNNTVGSPDVQQYASLKQQQPNVDVVTIVTSGQFSAQAEDIANDLNVKLVNGEALYNLAQSTGTLKKLSSRRQVSQTTRSQTETPPTKSNQHSSDERDTTSSYRNALLGGAAILSVLIILAIIGLVAAFVYAPSLQGPVVGDSVTEGGMKVTVLSYTTADQLGGAEPKTPPQGAQYILFRVRVENVGETEQTFPDTINLIYQSEESTRFSGFDPVTVNNRTIKSYYREQRYSGYPGTTVMGWVIFEIPEDFDRSEVVLEIENVGKEGETIEWRLPDAENGR